MRLRDILAPPGFMPRLMGLCGGTFAQRRLQPLLPRCVAASGPAPETGASVPGAIVAGGARAATRSANLARRLGGHVPHARVLVVARSACAGGSALLVWRPTALQGGLLRVALGLFAGRLLTLAHGLGAAVSPVAHRASAFGVLHRGAQMGSAVSPRLRGGLAASSLRRALLGHAALRCGGTVVAWHGLGARQAAPRAAAPPGAEG